MALDKLVDSAQLDADLTSVANAIRTKGGTSGSLAFPAGFVSAIGDIPSGSGYTADEFFNDMSIPTGKVTLTRSLGQNDVPYLFANRTGITEIEVRNATALSNYFAYNCTGLTNLTAPNVATVYTSALYGTRIKYLVLPRFYSNNQNAFGGNTALLAADFGRDINIYSQAFAGDSNLTVVVLRSSTLSLLNNINVFNNTPFASGKSGGTLYVPSSLISSYQNATNWSTILGYENNSIQAIEGSIYENAYADGTPIT